MALLAAKGLLVAGLDGSGTAAIGDEASRTDSAPDETDWSIRGSLLARRAAGDAGRNRGGLRLHPDTGEPFLGGRQLHDLTNLERGALVYLLGRPRQHVPKTELIEGVWPDDVVEGGIMDDALYQVVRACAAGSSPHPASRASWSPGADGLRVATSSFRRAGRARGACPAGADRVTGWRIE